MNQENKQDFDFISQQEYCEITGYTIRTVIQQRSKGEGLPYYKIGKKIYYKRSELIQALEDSKVTPRS